MRFKLSFLAFSFLFLFVSRVADGREVYINGVNMKNVELTNQVFKGCTVTIDDKGNIHIKAPGVVIQTSEDADKKTRTKVEDEDVDGEFYLVSFTNRPGATQYDIEVFINGKFVRRIRSTTKQVSMKISHLLKKGKNEIMFVSRKNYGGKDRVSESSMDYMRVVLGKGVETKGRLIIRTSEAEVKRTAEETREKIIEKQTIVVK